MAGYEVCCRGKNLNSGFFKTHRGNLEFLAPNFTRVFYIIQGGLLKIVWFLLVIHNSL